MRPFDTGALTVELLHVGDATTMPRVQLPKGDGWTWTTTVAQGTVVDEILRAAARADLLVLTTQGRQGFLDALRGSTTERVIRGARCPVLAVPTLVPAGAVGRLAFQPSTLNPAIL